MARNETSRDRRARGVGRMVAILVLIGIAAANSALFYFIIWPEFSPHDPFSAILFFISGGAHLIYFFIPCLSGYHPHPLYVVCLLGLQARAGAGALRRRSG